MDGEVLPPSAAARLHMLALSMRCGRCLRDAALGDGAGWHAHGFPPPALGSLGCGGPLWDATFNNQGGPGGDEAGAGGGCLCLLGTPVLHLLVCNA